MHHRITVQHRGFLLLGGENATAVISPISPTSQPNAFSTTSNSGFKRSLSSLVLYAEDSDLRSFKSRYWLSVVSFALYLPASCHSATCNARCEYGIYRLTRPSIRSIAWNPTGHLIATGSADKTLRIWNPEKNQVKNSTELRGHTGAIERVAWNPIKEAELASVSSDSTCKFWDVRTKTCLASVPLGEPALTVTWAADGSVCLVGLKVSCSNIYL